MSETLDSRKFTVEGEQGCEDECITGGHGSGKDIEGGRGGGEGDRRRFTVEYKVKVLKEADVCQKPGEVGALLRREGLYRSHVSVWRAARDRGEIAGLTPKKRGPKRAPPDPRETQLVALARETQRWKARAERAEALVDIQKKVSMLLGIARPARTGAR